MTIKKEIIVTGNFDGAVSSVKKFEDKAKKSFKGVEDSVKGNSKEIDKAFRVLGLRTTESVEKANAKLRVAYRKIKNDGTSSADDVLRAHDAMERGIVANNRKILGSNKKLLGSNKKLSTSFKLVKGNIRGIATGIVAASAGAALFFRKTIGESVKFEASLLDLQKVLGDGEGDAKDYTKQIDALAKTYGESGSEILAGVANFKQAGFSIEESLQLQKNALDLVIAGDLEAARASDLIVASLKGFKAPASEAGRLIDVLNEVSNNYATNIEELASGMAELSPIAAKMGFSFEETAGVLTPVIEVFRSGSESASALKIGLLNLVSDEKRVQEALASIGVAQHDANGELRSGKDILADVSGAFVDLDNNQKTFLAAQLVGKNQAARMVEVFDGLKTSMDVTSVAMKSNGSAAKEVEIRLSSTEKQIDKFKTSLSIMSREIGDVVLPTFNKFLKFFTGSIPTVTKFLFSIPRLALKSARGIAFIGEALAKVTDFFKLTSDGAFIFNAAIEELDGRIKAWDKKIDNVGKTTDGLTKSQNKAKNAIDDVSTATKKQDKAQEDLAVTIKKRAHIEKEGLKTNISAEQAKVKSVKSFQAALKASIQEQRSGIKALEGDINTILGRAEELGKRIEEAAKRRGESGLTSGQVNRNDFAGVQGELDFLQDAFGRGELTFQKFSEKLAALEGPALSIAESTKGMFKQRLVDDANKFLLKIIGIQKDLGVSAGEHLPKMQTELARGEKTLSLSEGFTDRIAENIGTMQSLMKDFADDAERAAGWLEQVAKFSGGTGSGSTSSPRPGSVPSVLTGLGGPDGSVVVNGLNSILRQLGSVKLPKGIASSAQQSLPNLGVVKFEFPGGEEIKTLIGKNDLKKIRDIKNLHIIKGRGRRPF